MTLFYTLRILTDLLANVVAVVVVFVVVVLLCSQAQVTDPWMHISVPLL